MGRAAKGTSASTKSNARVLPARRPTCVNDHVAEREAHLRGQVVEQPRGNLLEDKMPRPIEQDGEALAVVSSAVPTLGGTVHAFCRMMTTRVDVREILFRLVKK